MQEYRFQPQPFGKYMLTERIGAGGMAEIFRAIAYGVEGFTKEVCIKRILPTLTADETFIRMFIAEAKIAVTLHHTNIVQVFDLGRIGEHYFIAMELVKGRDLLQIINQCRAAKQRVPVPIALYIMARVCQGLDYAHRVKSEGRPMGIIHRDVSPSNILVSWEGEVKVADFGIAKAAFKDEKTVTGTLKGKYGYMSPEQVRGDPVDHRSDIFAAGILLWESLVGKRLFKGPTDLETLERVRAAEVQSPPSKINKSVTPEIDALVLKALSLHVEDRYQTAGAFHDAIADQLFSTGQRIDSTTLAAFMQEQFSREIQREEELERERSRPGFVPPPPPYDPSVGTPTPTPSGPIQLPAVGTGPPGPSTRHDIPPGTTRPEGKPPMSSLAIGLLATLGLLLAGGAVVLVYWLVTRPRPLPPGEPVQQPAVVTPRPEPAPSPEPTPRKGTLSISSQPAGARVILDGQPTGRTTPTEVGDLDRARPHTVKLALRGHKPWSKRVVFGDMQMVALDAQLTRRPKRPRPRPHPKPRFGTLNINAVPVWAYVYVDGQKQDRPTPLYNLRLKAGTHTVRLVNPKLGLTKTRKINVRAGKSSDLVVEMK